MLKSLIPILIFSGLGYADHTQQCPIYEGETYTHIHQHGSNTFYGTLEIHSTWPCGRRLCYEGVWNHSLSTSPARAMGAIAGNRFEMTRIWNWEGTEYRQLWRGTCGSSAIVGTWRNTFGSPLSGTFRIDY